jgi:glycosyltransferase involved in cell wall biosynthesis
MKPLRLCFVGPAQNITTRRWVQWFSMRGHEATVLTVEPAAPHDVQSFHQIDLTTPGVSRKLGRLISAIRLALHIRRFTPDIVHVHYLRGLAWGMLLCRYHPYVATPWGSDVLDEQGAFRDRAGRILTTGVLNQADLVTAHSRYLGSRVKELLRGSTPIAHIGWGVDLALFRPGVDTVRLRQRWRIGRDQQVIFSPRLAQPFYRHEIVIEAFREVREKFPDAVLVITEQFAEQRYVQQLRRLVNELRLGPSVRFVGSISYEEMPQWLNLSKIVVMVPRSDGMPNTLLEAMACGAFPVLNRLPQYEGVIRSGWNGLLVDSVAGALSDAMQVVLNSAALEREARRRNRKLIEAIADQDHEMERMVHWYDRLRMSAA